MTDHDRILAIAAADPAFRPGPEEERDLRAHLRTCPACTRVIARMRADLDAVGRVSPAVSPRLHDLLREAAVTTPRTGPSATGVILALVLLAVASVGVAAGVGAFQASRPTPDPTIDPRRDVVAWRTDRVALSAKEFWIDAAGERFEAPVEASIVSDPGDAGYWTLEVQWVEHGTDQRLYLYFAADGAEWWIDGIQAWDSSAFDAERRRSVAFPAGQWARTPIGRAFEPDLDMEGEGAGGPVSVHLGGVHLAVNPRDHVNAPVPGAPAPNAADLGCSGVLQLAPPVAGGRLRAMGWAVDWRWQYATGPNTGTSEVRDEPPATGFISGTAPGQAGVLVVFVEDPERPLMPAVTPPPRLPQPVGPSRPGHPARLARSRRGLPSRP